MTWRDTVWIPDSALHCAGATSCCSKLEFEKKRRDGDISERMSGVEEWRCREIRGKEGFQCREKAVRQNAGLDGSDDEEREQKGSPD